MQKPNYQRELDALLQTLPKTEKKPTLLLQACCGPCSSYVVEYLSRYFSITILYYNPNIAPESEYHRRGEELAHLLQVLPEGKDISLEAMEYHPEVFYQAVKGLEQEPEGGERCFVCYRLRLEETAKLAKAREFDYFCSTLSISPHKNATKLNEIGTALAEQYGVPFLPSDFKKKGGYQRSLELSKAYGLYRQDYCGCVFSMRHS